MKDLALALRPTVFPPHLALRIASQFDGAFDSFWFPSIGASFDSLELCALSLGASRRSRAGTGVVRLAEYDLGSLSNRINTLAEASGDRFVLGVGTGALAGRTALDQLVDNTEKLRASRIGKRTVPVYFAALGPKMVRAAFQHADGVLLNFCSPGYVRRVTRDLVRRDGHRVACYIKLFFAETDVAAIRMLADEFIQYDSFPQYHAMFEAMGLSGASRVSGVGVISRSARSQRR